MNKPLLLKSVLLTTLIAAGITASAQVASNAKRDTAKKTTAQIAQRPVNQGTATPAKPVQTAIATPQRGSAVKTQANTAAKPPVNQPVKNFKTLADNTGDDATGGRGKTFFIELGGPGLALTANYDFRFSDRQDGFGMRIGAGGFAADGNTLISAPVQFNYLVGKHSKYFEIGAGGTFMKTTGNSEDSFLIFDRITGVVGTFTFGYRYQAADGGFSFRAAINPIIYNQGFIPAAGLSFGYSF